MIAQPYVYRLDHRETGEFYIGYRAANKVPAEQDLGIKYFTSSKYIIEIGFDKFRHEIIAIFFDANSAYDFEQEYISEVFKDPLCLNKHYQNKNGQGRYKNTHNYTVEDKQRISDRMTGRTKETYPHLAEAGKKRQGRTIASGDQGAITRSNKLKGRTKENDASHASQAKKMSKTFRLVDPQGDIHIGQNLNEFCQKYGLNQGRMALICRTEKNLYHKGWTGKYESLA